MIDYRSRRGERFAEIDVSEGAPLVFVVRAKRFPLRSACFGRMGLVEYDTADGLIRLDGVLSLVAVGYDA